MQKLNRTMKEEMCRRFAHGESVERVAEEMQIEAPQVKHVFLQYLALPIGEKLAMTMLPELVTNRVHRLADDIRDIQRIDALVPEADIKTLVALLDMKRKIKERMLKDSASSGQPTPIGDDAEMDEVLAECYERVMGAPMPG